MENNNNDKKVAEYKKNKIKKWTIIILYVAVIALEVLALCNVIDMLWGCFLFILVYLFKKFFLK